MIHKLFICSLMYLPICLIRSYIEHKKIEKLKDEIMVSCMDNPYKAGKMMIIQLYIMAVIMSACFIFVYYANKVGGVAFFRDMAVTDKYEFAVFLTACIEFIMNRIKVRKDIEHDTEDDDE